MFMKQRFLFISLAVAGLCFVSCDKFLDVMPDNRTEIDSKEKVRAIITSAYPDVDYLLLSEFMSDNVDDFGPNNPNTDRFVDQVYHWQVITEEDNAGPEELWGGSYIAIAGANQAIQAINDMGGAEKTGMQAEMAEALLCRAYNHFILVNMFAKSYNSKTPGEDMGITYMQSSETTLNPKYDRNTVKEVYELIDKDLQAALPYVSDAYYTVPKYHFNQKAAYSFATRFYLFYEKWDEAIKYANLALGSQPAPMLRDWKYVASMTQDEDVVMNHYIDATLNANVMLVTAKSLFGACFDGRYSVYSKYAHGNYLATYEDGIALASLFGMTNTAFFYSGMKVYKATNHDKTIFWKIPYLFEFTDPVAQIGYYRTVYPAFWAEETLLNRAEARILQGKYDDAAKDINLWIHNTTVSTKTFTVSNIVSFYNGVNYAEWNKPTVKKHLNPYFAIGKEGETKEAMLQCVVGIRRIETMAQGMRWFDIKRYGIEIDRRIMNDNGNASLRSDHLAKDDLRRAMQLPLKVTDAGLAKNPR